MRGLNQAKDGPQDAGVASELENSERENITGGDGDEVDGGAKGGDDNVSGADAAAASFTTAIISPSLRCASTGTRLSCKPYQALVTRLWLL